MLCIYISPNWQHIFTPIIFLVYENNYTCFLNYKKSKLTKDLKHLDFFQGVTIRMYEIRYSHI